MCLWILLMPRVKCEWGCHSKCFVSREEKLNHPSLALWRTHSVAFPLTSLNASSCGRPCLPPSPLLIPATFDVSQTGHTQHFQNWTQLVFFPLLCISWNVPASLLVAHVTNLGLFFYLCPSLALNADKRTTSILNGLYLLRISPENPLLSAPVTVP